MLRSAAFRLTMASISGETSIASASIPSCRYSSTSRPSARLVLGDSESLAAVERSAAHVHHRLAAGLDHAPVEATSGQEGAPARNTSHASVMRPRYS
jgi:hypothetical protein